MDTGNVTMENITLSAVGHARIEVIINVLYDFIWIYILLHTDFSDFHMKMIVQIRPILEVWIKTPRIIKNYGKQKL